MWAGVRFLLFSLHFHNRFSAPLHCCLWCCMGQDEVSMPAKVSLGKMVDLHCRLVQCTQSGPFTYGQKCGWLLWHSNSVLSQYLLVYYRDLRIEFSATTLLPRLGGFPRGCETYAHSPILKFDQVHLSSINNIRCHPAVNDLNGSSLHISRGCSNYIIYFCLVPFWNCTDSQWPEWNGSVLHISSMGAQMTDDNKIVVLWL